MVNIPSELLKTSPPPGTWLLAPQGGRYEAKSLSLLSHEGWAVGSGRTPGVETLARSVSWVYIALTERAAQIREIPMFWTRGEGAPELPPQLGFNPWVEMARVDEAIQLYGSAYYHKQRNRGRGMIRLKWLDPATIEPDEATVLDGEYQWYRRTGDDGRQVMIPADDILRLWIPRLRELAPGTTAGDATSLAAQISRNIGRTLDTFFETNGLPPILLSVPQGTSEQQRNSLQRRFSRLFGSLGNFDTGANKVIGIQGDVQVERLSFAPDELDTTRIDEAQREAILSAHGVPPAIVYKDVNLAEAREKRMMFASRIAGRIRYLMDLINDDPDVARYNVMLDEQHTRLEVFQRSELEKAEALQRLTGGAVMTVNEARERLELEPSTDPLHNTIYPPSTMLNTAAQAPPADLPDAAETPAARSVEVDAEAATFRRWLAKRGVDADPDDFRTSHLTAAQKATVYGEWATENRRDLREAFAAALVKFEEALTDDA